MPDKPHSTRSGALLALILFGAAARAVAATPVGAAVEISVDPRIELLGVVALLAGTKNENNVFAEYRAKVERRFAPFRDQPVVRLYRELVQTQPNSDLSVILLYYSAPPEIALVNPASAVPHWSSPGAGQKIGDFLAELRRFAHDAEFMKFYRENKEFYAGLSSSARKKLDPANPVAALEAYLGIGLSSRIHYNLMLSYGERHAWIIPYPLPYPGSDNEGAKKLDVYSNIKITGPDDFQIPVWNEIVYVFLDPSFYYFEKMNIPDPSSYYGPKFTACRSAYSNCTKDYVSAAIISRLRKEDAPSDPVVAALARRLAEYEGDRARYPTLWTFYPRLFSVFHELSFSGTPAAGLSVPADPKIRNATDLFDPAVTQKLLRPGRVDPVMGNKKPLSR